MHFLHLIVGMCALAWVWRAAAKPDLGQRDLRTMGSCAAYWHLVDLLWLVLFALLYLMN